MNPQGMMMHRASTKHIAIKLAALAVLCFLGGGRAARAQNPPAEKIIYSFAPATGYSPAGLTGDSAGNLYVATDNGGSNRKCGDGCGSVLKLSRPYGKPTTLYTFLGFLGNRNQEPSGLVRDPRGNLFVATATGGHNGFGAVYKVLPSGSAGILYSFQGGIDGNTPASGLTIDPVGNLYGTTKSGGGTGCGGLGCGTIFKMSPSGSETVLYSFTGGADGLSPLASPLVDSAGNLYGTAINAGDLNCPLFPGGGCGTVWKLDTSGNFSVLYAFTGGTDGAFPRAGLVMDSSANLYGTASYGGDPSCNEGFGCGVVFKIDSSGNFTTLYSFTGEGGDGQEPADGTIFRDSSGNLYETTLLGGDQSCSLFGVPGCGVVFKLDPLGNETILHAFTGGATDGAGPELGLITDGKGNLFGTTPNGGLANVGVIFQVQMQ